MKLYAEIINENSNIAVDDTILVKGVNVDTFHKDSIVNSDV